jgi:hypothetical protein
MISEWFLSKLTKQSETVSTDTRNFLLLSRTKCWHNFFVRFLYPALRFLATFRPVYIKHSYLCKPGEGCEIWVPGLFAQLLRKRRGGNKLTEWHDVTETVNPFSGNVPRELSEGVHVTHLFFSEQHTMRMSVYLGSVEENQN